MPRPLIACLCPTYKRPEHLRNAIACFVAQTHPHKLLLILDDAGQHAAQDRPAEGWRLLSRPHRYANLPAKLNALAACAPEADILAIWEDDDIYLPHHLAAIAEAAGSGSAEAFFAPTRVLSTYGLPRGRTQVESAAGRFHASWAYTRSLFESLRGYDEDDGLGFDQRMGARCAERAAVVHPDLAPVAHRHGPSYVYRWGRGPYNGSQTGDEGYANLWRELGEMPFERVEATGARMDDETRRIYTLHGWQRSVPEEPAVVRVDVEAQRSDEAARRRDLLRLENALLDDSDDGDLTLALAEAQAASGDRAAALRAYRRCADLGGDAARTWYALYQAARMLDDHGFATPLVVEAYFAAYDRRPTKAEPLLRIARRCLRDGRHETALDIARAALATPLEDRAFHVEHDAYRGEADVLYLRALLALGRHADVVAHAEARIADERELAPAFAREIDDLRRVALQQRDAAAPAAPTPAEPRAATPSNASPPAYAATPRRERRKLCIGMATYDDYDGVYFSVQAIRLFHPEVADQVEIVVVDNHPAGKCAEGLKGLDAWIPNYRYVPEGEIRGTATRDLIFREANADYVLVMDCHVFVVPGALKRLLDYFDADPGCRDLLQGPLLYDDLSNLSTHFEPVWRQGMYGTWSTDPRGQHADAPAFDIPMQGLGVFACRRDAWPGFNPRFRGFGGEEGYLHAKFRQAGARTLCLPFLRWLHRFHRPLGIPYTANWFQRVRNYAIGHHELGLDRAPVEAHFAELLGEREMAAYKARIDAEIASPLFVFDAVYAWPGADASRTSPSDERTAFERLGIGDRVVTPAFAASAPADDDALALERVLAHRRIVERAKRQGLRNVLIVENAVDLERALADEHARGRVAASGAEGWSVSAFASTSEANPPCAVAYQASIFDHVLATIPEEPERARRWMADPADPLGHLKADRILARHRRNVATAGDITEHLETLKRFAAEASHVTEMGVRDVVSTWSLLAGRPGKAVCYDVHRSPRVDDVEAVARDYGIAFDFVQRDVLDVDIEPTDLLFIDTVHTYDQLRAELDRHGNKSRKYILLHDTTTYGEVGEDGRRPGLQAAIDEFLARNRHWRVAERFAHNNGLTCLERRTERASAAVAARSARADDRRRAG
ncbi:hypothetical protein BURK1_02394 [Burkholderiales bacterium]|nr:hypothetical protein BURK1_02394 [Burkholderiales bacterium]